MRRTTYSMWDELMASPTEPLSSEKRQHQLVRMFSALDNLVKADAPTKEDWRLCSDAVNMVESLIDMGVCQDESGLLMDAVTALAKAGKRNVEGKPIRLDGQGLTAVRGILNDYADLLAVIPARVMIRCHRRTEKRIFDILRGKKQPHDVEIVSR